MLDYGILKGILETRNIGRTFLQFEYLQSSNKKAKSILSHSPNGMVIYAEEQWDGKINKNNSWYSPKGGLYLSIIIKNKIEADLSSLLNLMVLSSLYKTIYQYGIKIGLKWPNDMFYLNKKLGSVSVDKYFIDVETAYIVDICVNYNIEDKELFENVDAGTISLLNNIKEEITIEIFIADILNNFEKDYNEYVDSKDASNIYKTWYENCKELNGKIQIRKTGNKKWIDVKTDGFDSLGKLKIIDNKNILEIIDNSKYELQIIEEENEDR